MDIIILGGLILIAVGLGLFYLMRALVNPHKLDNIKKLMEAGKYQDAINSLNTFLKNDESNPLAHLYLAESYYYSGNLEMGLVEYKQVLSSGKFNKSATEKVIRKRLADIYMKFGQFEEAQKEYLLLIKLEPHNYEYLYSIGKIFYDRGMREQALAYLERVQKITHNHAPSFFLLGMIYYDMNHPTEALNAFMNCLKLEPKNSESHFYVGMILKAMGNFGKAITEFDESEKAKESLLKVKSIFQKGLCKLEMGDVENAIADFERSLKYSTDDTNVMISIRYTLGLAYEKQRRLLEAVEQWEKVSQMRPNFKDVQTKLGQYEDLRIDDKLKDLMTATPTTYEYICQKVVGGLGYEVIESSMMGDDTVQIVGVEKSQKWRNVRGGRVLVMISRSNNDIMEDEVAALVERTKLQHGIRSIYITTGKFAPMAMRYSENRPVDLFDRQKLSGIMKNL